MSRGINDIQLENLLKNILWLRIHFGISKKKMAELLKIGMVSLNKIENGELPPKATMDIIFNIHKNFGIKPHLLFVLDFNEINPLSGEENQ